MKLEGYEMRRKRRPSRTARGAVGCTSYVLGWKPVAILTEHRYG
jgi:hypothetical protein